MNRNRGSQIVFAALASMTTVLLFCPAGAAVGGPPVYKPKMETELLSAFAALKGHIQGKNKLDAEQIEAHKLTIDKHKELFGYNDTITRACLGLVATYDQVKGPLWVAHGGFNRRKGQPANDLHWTVYNVMQNIMDRVYTAKNVARYGDILNGFKFGSSAHFPGAVEPPADRNAAHTVKINGSYLKQFKHVLMHEERPARRPTGTYLAPGTIATVKAPPSIVGKGYQVRVGAHSWDNTRKPRILRLDRSSLVYGIDGPEVKVASPLGGGIYIEVPMKADAGIVKVTIRNAVRSPCFSAKPFHQTSLAEWQNVERKHKAPWADFQSEKFMMQVPTSWICKLDDPVALMKNWDAAMDAMNDLMGLPRVWGKETMYLQVDLQNRSRVFAPGYPTVNDRYDPRKEYEGYVDHYLVRGPQFAPSHVFHEQGHAYLFVKFGGEMESTVNLLHVAVWHQKFGYSLDEAFRGSRSFNKNEHRTLDNTAVTRMTSLSFVNKKPMHAGEKAYQLKGHAKFVDIARLFGWKVLNDFWASWTADREAGRPWSKHGTDIDKLSLRLSQKAGVDLTPLLHFWGTPPRDAAALKAAVVAEKLPPSAKVYDTLMRYKSLVPANNQAFRDFATKWWGRQPSAKGYWTEREHAKHWEGFNKKTSAQIKQAVQEIIHEYFRVEKQLKATRPTLVSPKEKVAAEALLEKVETLIKKEQYAAAVAMLGKLKGAEQNPQIATRAAQIRTQFTAQAETALKEAQKQTQAKQYYEASVAIGHAMSLGADTHQGAEARKQYQVLLKKDEARAAIEKGKREKQAADLLAALEKTVAKKTPAAKLEAYDDLANRFPNTKAGAGAAANAKAMRADKDFMAGIAAAAAEKDCKGWLSMARNFINAGHRDKARPYLDKVITQYPGTTFADEAKAMLAKMEK